VRRKYTADTNENVIKFNVIESTSSIQIEIEYNFNISLLTNMIAQISELQILSTDFRYHELEENGSLSEKTDTIHTTKGDFYLRTIPEGYSAGYFVLCESKDLMDLLVTVFRSSHHFFEE